MPRLVAFLALGLITVFSAAAAEPAVAHSTKQIASDAVLRHTAAIVGIPPGRIAVDKAFAFQAVPADDLDIVEIVMAVEEELDISIDDALLGSAADSEDLIADRLTVRQLQEVVAEVLSRKPGR